MFEMHTVESQTAAEARAMAMAAARSPISGGWWVTGTALRADGSRIAWAASDASLDSLRSLVDAIRSDAATASVTGAVASPGLTLAAFGLSAGVR